METKTIELTEVVLPDGSKAWFESKKSAEAVISLVGKMKELLDGRDYWLGGNKEKKPKMSGKVEGVPTEEECAKVEKKTVSAKITPPRKNAQISEHGDKEPTNARGYVYAERTCDVCGNAFSPHSGRQKICDACREAGYGRKRNRKGKEAEAEHEGSDGLGRTVEDEKSEPAKKRGRPRKDNGVISDALAEVRKLAKEAHLGQYKD